MAAGERKKATTVDTDWIASHGRARDGQDFPVNSVGHDSAPCVTVVDGEREGGRRAEGEATTVDTDWIASHGRARDVQDFPVNSVGHDSTQCVTVVEGAQRRQASGRESHHGRHGLDRIPRKSTGRTGFFP